MMWAERVVCLITIVISAVFFALTFTFPRVSADPAGMALFPRIAGAAAALAAIIILLRGLRAPRGAGDQASADAVTPLLTTLRRIVRERATHAVVLSIVYPWFIIKVGFVIATMAYVFTLMKLFRTSTVMAGVYCLFVAGGLYGAFVYLLEAYVPPGAWLEWIWV